MQGEIPGLGIDDKACLEALQLRLLTPVSVERLSDDQFAGHELGRLEVARKVGFHRILVAEFISLGSVVDADCDGLEQEGGIRRLCADLKRCWPDCLEGCSLEKRTGAGVFCLVTLERRLNGRRIDCCATPEFGIWLKLDAPNRRLDHRPALGKRGDERCTIEAGVNQWFGEAVVDDPLCIDIDGIE
jgi:hypothetical protein